MKIDTFKNCDDSNNQLFTQNNFNIVTLPRQYFGPVTIQKLQIQLLDEYGRILFLMGQTALSIAAS
ncbi:MAG: hypothetical protein EBT35_08655 [Alphaproteobacteria bacterium]|nr:hypothetical protein [Alphaproteobacteria bacterium]